MEKPGTLERAPTSQGGYHLVASLLDTLDQALLVSDRSGRVLFSNLHVQNALNAKELGGLAEQNLFQDVLHTDRREITAQLESGEHEIHLSFKNAGKHFRARIRWLPEQVTLRAL